MLEGSYRIGHTLELVIWVGNNWVNCVGGNSTMILFATSHFDVTTITPLIGPWILDQEILVSIFFSETNGENTMVKILWRTVWFVINSRFVKLEGWIWSIDSNGNWSNMFQSMSQTFFVTFWTHGKTFIISSTMGLGVPAWFKVDGFIWIRIFVVDTILVLKSPL